MITKFKIFESINKGKPEIGDYIVSIYDDNFKNQIGKIIAILSTRYKIQYTIPYEQIYELRAYEIKYFSKNIEELEAIIDSKKYNL